MLRLQILVTLVALPSFVYCQSKKTFTNESITYSKLAEILKQEKWDSLYFEKVNFAGDLERRPWEDSVFGRSLVVKAIKTGKFNVLEFNDCSFSESIVFEGDFEGNVAMTGCKGPQELVFENCHINALWISDSKFKSIFFQHAKFDEAVISTEDDEKTTLSFFRTSIHKFAAISGSRISIVKSNLDLKENSTIENDGKGNVWTTVSECEFNQADSSYLQFIQNDGYLQLMHNKFSGGVDLYGEGDRVTWNLIDNVFEKEVGFRSGAELGPSSYINFKDIYNKKPLGWHIDDDDKTVFYNGEGDQIAMERYYTNLLRLHKRFHDFYLQGGDIYSANILYVRIKDLETRHLEYQHQSTPSFDLWIRIRLNNLLKFYTRYGTDPARAIIISLWVIFGFAVFYVFVPSSRSKLFMELKEITNSGDGWNRKTWRIVKNSTIALLNAFTLSLNAFTTLGFGEIPTQGFARYVTIGEGFLGWFLLTLFSVALISQSSF